MTSTTKDISGSSNISTPTDRELRIERIFDAPLERVWQAYTDPQLLSQWWGRGNKLEIEKWEFERGGHWRFVEYSDEGVHGFEGRFRDIAPLQRIVQTFEWDGMPGYVSIDTVTFEDLGDGRTRAISRSLFHTIEERDNMLAQGMEQGINQSYAALDKLLGSMS